MIRGWNIACLLCAIGCGGASSGLDLHFQSRMRPWNEVAQRIAASAPTAPSTPSASLVFAVSASDPATLLALDAAHAIRWQSATTADAVIHTAGDVVFVVEDGALIARDTASGQRLFSHPLAGMSLLGVAQEGETLAWISAAPSITATEPVSTITVATRTGRVRWQRTISAALGAPLLRDGVLVVPWNRQGLTAIDLNDGHELARLHADHLNVDWLDNAAAGIIYGSDEIHDLACTQTSCPTLRSPFVTAPSQPALHVSSYRATARSGIQPVYDITRNADHELSFTDDRAYLVFYRFVFAYDAAGTLVWLRTLNHDVLHARGFLGGLALLDADGTQIRLRSSDGAWLSRTTPAGAWRTAKHASLPSPLSDAERSTASPNENLSSNLLSAVLDPDNRLLVARAYAVNQLARDPQPEVTQQLLDAYEQRSTPAGLRAVLAAALRNRRTGSEHLLNALTRHHDFLDGTTPAPLSVVVPALVAMNEHRAVPALLAHLDDPATAPEDLVVIAEALAALGDRSLSTPLVDWLRSYRASTVLASQPALVSALARAAHVLSAADASARLNDIASHATTQPVFAAAVHEALAPTREIAQAGSEPGAPDSSAAAPSGLDQRVVNAAFADRVDAIRACIVPEVARNRALSQVRIAFVARPDGSLHGFAFAPSSAALATCLQPLTTHLRLSPFVGKATLASYVIQLRTAVTPRSADADSTPPRNDVAEWWNWYARETPPTDGPPWWSRYVETELGWLPVATPTLPPAQAEPTTAATEPVQATSSPQPADTPATNTPPPSDDVWWLPPQP